MVDNKSKTKTKAEMLLELESIKGLLHEEDDIPILQETLNHKPAIPAPAHAVTEIAKSLTTKNESAKPATLKPDTLKPETPKLEIPKIEQQDLFNKTVAADSATHLLNTLNDLAALANTVATKTSANPNNPTHTSKDNPIESARMTHSRSESVKAAGENPFLPEHIRTRLHGNNPPPLFEFETAKKIAHVSRPTTQLGNTQHKFSVSRPTSHQQELIDDVVDAMLPEIAKELRLRLAAMSKEMLEILLAEHR